MKNNLNDIVGSTGTMKVCLLRHAQATHNAAAAAHGESEYESWEYEDALLTPLGHTQASNVILPFMPDRIYSSPLRRCIQTARALTDTNTNIYLYDGLIERQGHHPCNLRSHKSGIIEFDTYTNTDNIDHVYNHTFSHRETDEEVRMRASHTLSEIYADAARAGATQILIVTHWDVLKVLFNADVKNAQTHLISV
jgi:broad specificity phosphatase PhoE